MSDFSDWLIEELNKRDWTQADLVRASKGRLTTAHVSRVINGRQNAGVKFCEGVAFAFNVTSDVVLRHARILPKEAEKDEWLRKLEHKLSQINNDDDRRLVEGLIDLLSPSKKSTSRRNAEQ